MELTQLLLENGADANIRYSNSGKTPLFVAVEKGEFFFNSKVTYRLKFGTKISF